jgi:SAM-dependent methyltransferase
MTDPIDSSPALADLPDYVRRNREYWNAQAPDYAAAGHRAWAYDEPTWGVFGVPESTLHVLPADLAGKDAVELGCGTAYVSAWLARRGARPVGIDNSPEQLRTAQALQGEFDLHFPLHLGNAEATPFAAASFDLAISEYGASIWADPYKWIPEVARILRPGGELIFLVNGTIWLLAIPDEDDLPPTERLLRPYFGMHRFEWPDSISVDFHLGYGDWIRLLRANGFEVEDLIEVRPAEDARSNWPMITLEWARKWPVEEIWKARKVP